MTSKNVLDVYRFTGLPFDLGRYDVKRVGRRSEWESLLRMVAETRNARSPILGLLLGTYGSGKSFMLWQLAGALAPATKTKVLASNPVRLIDPEQKKDFTKSLILRFFSRGLDYEKNLAAVLRSARFDVEKAPIGLRPFVALLAALAEPAGEAAARRVLSGGRILRKEAEEAGFPEITQVRTSDDALSLLQALQLLVKSAGVEAVVMLVDEAEYIDGLGKSQRVAALDSLKHLWDEQVAFFSRGSDAAQLLMVFAGTPSFWQNLKGPVLSEGGRGESSVGITPFIQRIRKADIIEMPAELGADEARQLIVGRMSEVRPGSTRGDIIPFADDYVSYVYELSQGLPRQIIEICSVVLTEAAQRNLKSIDRSAAKKILRDLLLSYEPTGASE